MVLQGRIVIYSIVGCPHCLQAKSTLKEKNLPFVEVSVDRFPPHVRTWVKEKTNKTSVPQIFFNKTYIGGNAELQTLIKNEAKWQEMLEEVTNNEAPDDSDPLLPNPSEALDSSKDLKTDFHCEMDEYSILMEELKASGIVNDLKQSCFLVFRKKIKDTFSAKNFIEWVMKHKEIDETKALELGQELLQRKFIFPLNENENSSFKNDASSIYQLGSGLSNQALNKDKVNTCAQRPAGEVAEDLRKLILQIFATFLSADGKKVDYKGIQESAMFETYKAMARELQRVDLQELNKDDKLAFFINIYNALVIHGNIEKGTPVNTWQRYKFFSTTSYDIGGLNFTLNDIENGILRGNKASMATLYLTPFATNDPKLQYALDTVEPRIHFALNCGAKSCPPIKTFTSKNIQEELKTATQSYLENDDAIIIDQDTVHLSMLFKWYASDFGQNKEEILNWITNQMAANADKKEPLDLLLKNADNVKLKYITYDWGHNDKE